MTLTEPPHPLTSTEPDGWPAHTSAGDLDVSIAGVSLLRLVDWCETPCVHNSEAVAGRNGSEELASVVVSRVLSVGLGAGGSIQVLIDAELDGCRAIVDRARIIGRIGHPTHFPMLVRSARAGSSAYLVGGLPADLRAGDLVAIPCVGVTSLHDVRYR